MDNELQVKLAVPCFSSEEEARTYARVILGIPADALVVELLIVGAGILLVGGVAIATWYLWGKGGVAEPDATKREMVKVDIGELKIENDHIAATLIRAGSFLTEEDWLKTLEELKKDGSLEKIRANPVGSVRQILKVFKPLGVKIDKETVQAEWDRMVEAGKSHQDDEEKEKPKSDADKLVGVLEKGFQQLRSLLSSRKPESEGPEDDDDLKARSLGLGERVMAFVERFIPKKDTPEEPQTKTPESPAQVDPPSEEAGKDAKTKKSGGKKSGGKKSTEKPPAEPAAATGAEASG